MSDTAGRLERPRPWFTLDNAFLTRGSIEALADQFGAAGPLAIIALIGETNAGVGGGKRSDFDVLDWHYAYLARRIRSDAAKAKAIVHVAADVGLWRSSPRTATVSGCGCSGGRSGIRRTRSPPSGSAKNEHARTVRDRL